MQIEAEHEFAKYYRAQFRAGGDQKSDHSVISGGMIAAAEYCKQFGFSDRACQWWIGDWLNAGEQRWGEMYSQAVDETELAEQTLTDYKWVASAIQFSLRNEKVSFGVHRQIASMPEADRPALIQRAADESWTVNDARKKLGKGPHVAENSGEYEWYTPEKFIEAAA